VNKDYGHGREKQEGPLRKRSASDKYLAAVADGAFHFTFFDVLDPDLFSFSSDYDAGDKRLGFGGLRLRNRFTPWSILLRAFRRILGQRVHSQIESALRAGKSLDHLVHCYWLGESGHRA
jgi:hypothetical protein